MGIKYILLVLYLINILRMARLHQPNFTYHQITYSLNYLLPLFLLPPAKRYLLPRLPYIVCSDTMIASGMGKCEGKFYCVSCYKIYVCLTLVWTWLSKILFTFAKGLCIVLGVMLWRSERLINLSWSYGPKISRYST